MNSVWNTLQKPFFVLAPMEDVTDTVFRQMIGRHGAPDLYVTEFTNTDALTSKGERVALQRLQFEESERPIIAQIWGIHPKSYHESAKKIATMGFDGIDINMGCPQRDVIKSGACSALIRNHKLTKEIIQATKEGAPDLPLSVKTRLGFSEMQTDDWCGFLLEQNLAALTIHARTVKEQSLVPAHWEEVTKVVALRDKINKQTLIIGNGDVVDRADGLRKATETGADGIMIGRGIFHNLFAFREDSAVWHEVPASQKIAILKEHVTLYRDTWSGKHNYQILKKFFKIYVNGFPNASNLRVRFMETATADEAIALADSILKNDNLVDLEDASN